MDDLIKKKLQQLFLDYSQNLPAKIQLIESEWQGVLLAKDRGDRLEKLHRDVHSLCGSSGTYGYVELSKAARQMEIFLKDKLLNHEISISDQELVEHFIQQLKLTMTILADNSAHSLSQELKPSSENKLVYFIESDLLLVSSITQTIEQIGYKSQVFSDVEALIAEIKTRPPAAIILNTDGVKDEMIKHINTMQKHQQNRIQLFCILPNADLEPRLKAVRMGCDAFFQKPVDIYLLTKILNQKCGRANDAAYRILIIDDSKNLAEYYSLVLTDAGMITHTLSDPLQLLKEIDLFHPDLLLMDIYMPGCTGLELAAILRQENNYTKIPIIFMSTEEDKRKQQSAISLGGDDFLTKPISPQHLISAVNSRSKRAGILNYYMITDSLTGLLNHSTILSRLEIELSYARKNNEPLSFIMLDIDHFKKINDTYGHPVGDLVIKKIALLLSTQLRSQDIVGRYGGEEFAIVLPRTTWQEGEILCDKLRLQFSHYIFTHNSQSFSATFSAGISQSSPEGNIVIEADEALYKAKLNGRNQSIIYSK